MNKIFYIKIRVNGKGWIWQKCHTVTEAEHQILYKTYSSVKGWVYRTMSIVSWNYNIQIGAVSTEEKDGAPVHKDDEFNLVNL